MFKLDRPLSLSVIILLTITILFINQILSVRAEDSFNLTDLSIERFPDTDASIYDFVIYDDDYNKDFSYYDASVQSVLQRQINYLKVRNDYPSQEPLIIMNPYGTLNNSLYVYIESDTLPNIEYTIETELNGNEQIFQQSPIIKSNNQSHEFLIIGLVPNEINYVTLTNRDDNGNILSNLEFEIKLPRSKSFYPNQVQKEAGPSSDSLADGLYYMIMTGGFTGYSYFFDNDGIMRAELKTDAYRLDTIEFYQDHVYFASDSQTIAKMSPLGKIEELYTIPGYNMHHDFIIGQEDELLVLASYNDIDNPRREDLILSIDLRTGNVEELIDLKEMLGEYYLLTTYHRTSSGIPDLDWIHINSIEKTAEDEVILSAREPSTIIKISDLYGEPYIDYLIGPEEVWENTAYLNELLTPVNDFPIHAGQHSLNYSQPAELSAQEYYIEFYNNNYWWITTRPELAEGVDSKHSLNLNSNIVDSSYYYKYLVNEAQRTFELVDSIEVPYSSIVSNVQSIDSNIVINSGKANIVGEYDSNGELIAQFYYPSTDFTYRVFKNEFKDFWFE